MANSKIFCNVPWTNTHVYWDGGLGMCCSEKHRPYADDQWSTHNLSKLNLVEWYNSESMKAVRSNILGNQKLSQCQGCYSEESVGYESRRIKENFKSVIFTEQAFDKSYTQSPWFEKFESAKDYKDQSPPNDWHVDLGNECNLSCKMCKPQASSLIASKFISWGMPVDKRKNWTNDDTSWNNFLESINLCKINRLHFMGGEPMINKRFYQIIDHLLEAYRKEISISFVTNGTIFDQNLIDKLKHFNSCDIEISLESVSKNNDYIRQGIKAVTELVKNNIEKLLQQQTDKFHVVLRSVPQLLNVNNYHEYILWAYEKKLSIQGIPLTTPAYLSIDILPVSIRKELIKRYEQVKSLIKQGSDRSFTTIATGRDTSRLDIQLIKECDGIISILNKPEPLNVLDLRKDLAEWLIRWDKEFDLNAYDYYPEYTNFLKSIGYEV